MLTKELAETIVKETALRLKHNINIMNSHGIIIASGDASRLGHVHEGAIEVLKTGMPFVIPAHQESRWKGTQPGVNLPIEFQAKTIGVIGITGDPQKVEDFGGIIKMTTELMIKQAFIATQAEWKQRTKNTVIEELLKETPSAEKIDRRLDLLSITFSPPFHLVVIQIKDASLTNSTLLQNINKTAGESTALTGFVSTRRLLMIVSGLSGQLLVQKVQTVYQELKRLKVSFRLVYSTPCTAIEQISESYADCSAALAISAPGEDLISFADLETKVLIYHLHQPAASRLAERVFPPSVQGFADTLQVFFSNNLNIQHAADQLFIHRNTLIYRLNKIKQETGYDPKQFKDALTLQIAIWIFQKQHQ